MRAILRMLVALVAVIGFVGLLGAAVKPLAVADDEAEDDDGPSFYARAMPAVRPTPPRSAVQIQILLLQRRSA